MRLALSSLCLGTVVSAGISNNSAAAGPALVDEKARPVSATSPSPAEDSAAPAASDDREIEYGLGVRLRSVWVPKSVLELFVDRSAGGAQDFGIGVDLTRRRGTTELQLGFEYERVAVGQGVWINKGDDVSAGDEADYVLGPDASGDHLGWFTLEFTFLNHAEINPWLAFRYGGGIGLGIVTGSLDHYNVICTQATNANPEPGCVPMRFSGTAQYSPETGDQVVKYDLPPVFPVINAILGLQLKPSERMTINLEGGIRTLPFLGLSSSIFF